MRLLQVTMAVRQLTLSMLYFVQGAPYGFQTACLPIILREVTTIRLFGAVGHHYVFYLLQVGLSFTALGIMKLLFLPWVCKPLYAPIIERTKTKGDRSFVLDVVPTVVV